jgi:hypothetical protein
MTDPRRIVIEASLQDQPFLHPEILLRLLPSERAILDPEFRLGSGREAFPSSSSDTLPAR